MSCSRAEHTTEYLKPSQLFRETMNRTYYMPSAVITLNCVPVSPHIYHRSTKCRNFFSQIPNPPKSEMSCSRAEHQIEYLKPSQLFRETMKWEYRNPVFLGFSISNEYAIVTLSNYPISRARKYCEFPRDNTTLLDKLVDAVRSLKNDPVKNCGLLGIIVEDNNSVEDIHNFMDNLCKKGNFESLKYTCWKHNIESENSTWDRNAFGSLFWMKTFYPEHEHLEVLSAEDMLSSFLDFFSALYVDEDEKREDKDEEREDKDLEREHSKRKIEYLKPSQLFRETMKREYRNPVLLGFSFSNEHTIVTISNYPISRARIYGEFPRDITLLDKLVDVVQSLLNKLVDVVKSLENDTVEKYDLVAIIIDNNNSVKDIHNLMDNLCKKGNFKSLKYTCWKDDIGSKNSIYDSLFFSAELMLQRFQDVFRALCIDKDEEDKD